MHLRYDAYKFNLAPNYFTYENNYNICAEKDLTITQNKYHMNKLDVGRVVKPVSVWHAFKTCAITTDCDETQINFATRKFIKSVDLKSDCSVDLA